MTSPGLEGSRIVLESLASLENALTYCSATVSEAAASPFCGHRREKNHRSQTWRRGWGQGVDRGDGSKKKSDSWKKDQITMQITIQEIM